ncbi:hypothetical protein Bca52824_031189 [Brassica carinata]|uniref:Response regulatory domain-containing protein n=1 Tax=Brassica carinata TaxID=52824 RepID=A0A8X7SAJ0_BRACI|nr:hypothetical protein Bca52824_031189 [Brassica carinata]
MPLDGGVSCLRRSKMIGIGIGELESPPLDSDQVHVLAVDDSLVDRIVIERLLRITSCKVTAVDSGWRALEFLGCLEEGAEDFLLKPVKLADVKRLRTYLTRDVKVSDGNKPKLPEDLSRFSSLAMVTPSPPPPPSITSVESSLVPSSPLPPAIVKDSLTSSPVEMRSPGLD